MSISSTTVNNLSIGTSTLTITKFHVIENITYDNSTKSMTFAIHSAYSLSPTDFIKFAAILDTFNSNIVSVFNPNTFGYPTFSVERLVNTDDGSKLNYIFTKTTGQPIYNITATYPSGQVHFNARNFSSTLNYEEWLYYHATSTHFQIEINQRFRI